MLNISSWCIVGLHCVPGHAGVWGNEATNKLTRDGSVQNFVGPEPSLEVSRKNIKRKIKCYVDNKHLVMWCSLSNTQRDRLKNWFQAPVCLQRRDLGSLRGCSLWLLLAFLPDIRPCKDIFTYRGWPILCRRCWAEEETSAHILCECETLASLRCSYLSSLFLDPEDIKTLSLGITWNFSQGTGFPWPDIRL